MQGILVPPVNPHNRAHPNKNSPEESAPSTKYFKPDSALWPDPLFWAARINRDRVGNSMAKYTESQLLDDTKRTLPNATIKIKIGVFDSIAPVGGVIGPTSGPPLGSAEVPFFL